MWYDLGFDDWVVEIEESNGEHIADILMRIHSNYDASNEYLRNAMNVVSERHTTAMKEVERKV
jgi:hypothetical protein